MCKYRLIKWINDRRWGLVIKLVVFCFNPLYKIYKNIFNCIIIIIVIAR